MRRFRRDTERISNTVNAIYGAVMRVSKATKQYSIRLSVIEPKKIGDIVLDSLRYLIERQVAQILCKKGILKLDAQLVKRE